MSLVAISGNASGTGTLTIAAPNTNSNYTLTLPTNTGTLISTKSAGTVLQVVQTTKTNSFTTTSGSAVDITGLSVSITPSSTTSKILVSVMMETGHTGNDLGHSYLYLVRNSTNIFIADTAGSRKSATLVGNYLEQVMQSKVVQYLDSPSTTSSVTYKMQALTTAGTFCINRSGRDSDNTNFDGRGVSSITVMEIAA